MKKMIAGNMPEKNPGRKTLPGQRPVTGEQTKENTAGKTLPGRRPVTGEQAKKNPGPKINKGIKNPKMKPKQDYFEMASRKSMKGTRGKMK